MRPTKRLTTLGVMLAVVIGFGVYAGASNRASAQTTIANCTPAGSGTSMSCAFPTTVAQAAGLGMTFVSTSGQSISSLTAPFGCGTPTGLNTTTVTITSCDLGVPLGTAVTIAFTGSVAPASLTVTYNAGDVTQVTQSYVFEIPVSSGPVARETCAGTGGPGTTLTCAVSSATNALYAGGSVQVTVTSPSVTGTSCSTSGAVTGITATFAGGACIFANTGAVRILPGASIGTESFTIPAGTPVGTLITQTASNCLNVTTPCTPLAASTLNSPVPCSGVCTVLGAAAQVTNLESIVQGLGLPADFANSLLSKLQSIQQDLSSGATTDACNQLQAFSNQVQAQSGKQLTTGQASQLVRDANGIRSTIGCS